MVSDDTLVAMQTWKNNNLLTHHLITGPNFSDKSYTTSMVVCIKITLYIKLKGECKLMMVSHDALVAMQTWKNNNMLTWRNYSRYFYNEFEYGVIR